MTRLTGEAMREIAGKVFGERSMTLSEAGAAYELDELSGVVLAMRRMLRSSLESLPDSAYTPQPAGEGEAAWSAGQVVAHLANSQVSMSGSVRTLLDMPESAASDRYDLETLPTRDETLDILAKADTSFDAFLKELPADADLTASMTHERFGEMTSQGWMLLMALHEGDHAQQVRSLAE